MFSLQGKVAIVTGAGKGIGRACALAFAQAGADVALAARTQSDLDDVAAEIRALGKRAIAVSCDVSDEKALDQLVAATLAEFGKIHILVNNAGGSGPNDPNHTSRDEFNEVLTWNVTPAFLLIQKVVGPMRDSGGGSIINISSIDGLQSKNGLSAYSSTKWAVRGLTKSAAIELGKYGIRVNSVHPGGIFTVMGGKMTEDADPASMDPFYSHHPIPRVGLPHEVAYVTLFLATDEASYSTGSEFIADGGWNAGMYQDMMPNS